ncbi:MAG: cadherin domain-containing protein [Bacteroidales bacterium]|nr:cadherin domain-containing protein [Bacteroidales bacterium]
MEIIVGLKWVEKMKKRIFLSVFLFSLVYIIASGNIYYFSSIHGDDSNDGTSISAPWKSMDKLQQLITTLSAGDIVRFEKGSEWDLVKLDFDNLSATENNQILFSTYGQGAKPRFKGSKITGSFIRNGNIWRIQDHDLPDYVVDGARLIPFLYINNQAFEVSRYPDTDYLYTSTTDVDYYLEDSGESWKTNQWVNGLVAARVLNWKWYTRRINSNTSTRLDFDNFGSDYESSSTAYLIRNHIDACNLEGEWAQQNDTLWVYYSADLNSKKVEIPVIDIIFSIKNSRYIKFEGLQVERSNLFNIYVEGSDIEIVDCIISDAGGGLISTKENSGVKINGNNFSRGRRGGIFLEKSHGEVNHNTFKNMAFSGAANTEKPFGACVMNWYCDDVTSIDHNVMDSINLGYHGHWSNAENFISNNYITNFGITTRDCAAIYLGSDWTAFTKNINNNILINALNKFVHGIYIDYSSNNIKADSNTIANTNIAIFIHASKNNEITNTNIVNPAKEMSSPGWNQTIRLDEHIFNHGATDVSPVTSNVIRFNNIVLGQTPDETAIMYFNVINDKHSNYIDNNRYFNPFGSHTDIMISGEDYSSYSTYDFNDWKNTSGFDSQSELNPTNWTFQSVSGINEDDFVTLLFNPTDKDSIFDLRNYEAEFIDIYGNLLNESVLVPPYYSSILFYKQKYETTNAPPIINDQTFQIADTVSEGFQVGRIIANDINTFQTLSYQLTNGNNNEAFILQDQNLLVVNNANPINADSNFQLTVTVTDNASTPLTASAIITVNVNHIDQNTNDPVEVINNAPVVTDQEFIIYESHEVQNSIGVFTAWDQDLNQKLTYSIVAGNAEELFIIDSYSGEIMIANTNTLNFEDSKDHYLTIMVKDDAIDSKYAFGTAHIKLISENNTFYIDPTISNNVYEDGTIEYPFNSWNDVTWKEGGYYFQKSGTKAIEDNITFAANNVTIGAYGNGLLPVIQSNTNLYVLKGFDKSNITIKNLHISATEAQSCIYFLGDLCENIKIENCIFDGAENGVRVASGKKITFKYNTFRVENEGIYSSALENEIYYNIFKGIQVAVNILGNTSKAKIANNIFYNNRKGVFTSYAELELYNNIFYFANTGDQALINNSSNVITDHNIYYPEQEGFVEIAQKKYNNLSDLQQDHKLDVNSFVADPQFVDIYNDNFNVRTSSPAIDAGINVGIIKDYYGFQVPFGDAPDIGISEIISERDPYNISGIAEQIIHDLELFPNPSAGIVNIIFDKPGHEFAQPFLKVINMVGQVVISERVTNFDENSLDYSIDLSDHPNGFYHIILQIGNKVFTEPIIINH